MPALSTDARFLGIDLRTIGRDLRQAWASAQNVAPLSWLAPVTPVRLLRADGGTTLWWGDEKPVPPARNPAAQSTAAAFTAVELPEDVVLRHAYHLPAMSEADAAAAIALQASAISPFAEADLAHGYRAQRRPDGGLAVELALVSRRHIAAHLQTLAGRLPPGAPPEIWVTQTAAAPIVIDGYGENRRRAHTLRGLRSRYALLLLAAALLAAIAVTPSLQLRERALQAYAANQALAQRTAPLVKQRETLMQSAQGVQALADILAQRIEPLRVLDRLTQILPDDTALQSLTLKADKLTLSGLTSDAAALMQLLSEQPGMHDVRAPSPATRIGGVNPRENFTIELTLEPQNFGVTPLPESAASAPAPLPPGGKAAAGQIPQPRSAATP